MALPKAEATDSSPLARVMREFEELVLGFETGLRCSLHHDNVQSREDVRREACRLAISDLSTKYTRKYIRRSLNDAESEGKRVEEHLHNLSLNGRSYAAIGADYDDDEEEEEAAEEEQLGSIHNGYFRLYSTELFDLLDQPTDLRFGTLRFHKYRTTIHTPSLPQQHPQAPGVTVELALNNSFFVADSLETLPYHTFRMPTAPSLQNRGILSRKPEDNGAFPGFDSWLLFTFLGNGCIKLEVPIEMCADVYGSRLHGRENEEVLFWGFFVDDHVES